MGVLHADLTARDSLACDLMEPIRPQVDSYLLEWIERGPLRREWFFEERNGNCRLMRSFAARLTETASTWARAVGPYAEWIAQTLWSSMSRPKWDKAPATRLTHQRRLEARGKAWLASSSPVCPPKVCRFCGASIKPGDKYCVRCKPIISRENMIEAAKLGRIATISPKAQERRAATQRRQAIARRSWQASQKPRWLDGVFYCETIQPLLSALTVRVISLALDVSEPYATSIRTGRCIPHPRHWLELAKLVGISSDPNLVS
jgi:hypothetical protein